MDNKSEDERKKLLARAINYQVTTQGARVESQSDFQAVLVKGKPVNHTLQLILTLVTCGMWALVWIALAAFGGEKRYIVQIDDYGNTNVRN